MAKRQSTTDEESRHRPRPRELPLVALRETVIFPEMIVPLQVGRDKSRPGAQQGRRRQLARSRSSPSARPTARTSADRRSCTPSARWPRSPRSSSSRTAPSAPSSRASSASPLLGFVETEPFIRGDASRTRRGRARSGLEVQALVRTVQGQIEQYVQSGAPVPPEAAVAARNITEPGPARRHGRVQPGHDHRAAPGAARDDRRPRAAQARLAASSAARSRSSS